MRRGRLPCDPRIRIHQPSAALISLTRTNLLPSKVTNRNEHSSDRLSRRKHSDPFRWTDLDALMGVSTGDADPARTEASGCACHSTARLGQLAVAPSRGTLSTNSERTSGSLPEPWEKHSSWGCRGAESHGGSALRTPGTFGLSEIQQYGQSQSAGHASLAECTALAHERQALYAGRRQLRRPSALAMASADPPRLMTDPRGVMDARWVGKRFGLPRDPTVVLPS